MYAGLENFNTENQKDYLSVGADMYTVDSIGYDPNYQTVLYGIRLAPRTPAATFKKGGGVEIDYSAAGTQTGSPLTGEDDNDFYLYTVKSISVANRGQKGKINTTVTNTPKKDPSPPANNGNKGNKGNTKPSRRKTNSRQATSAKRAR